MPDFTEADRLQTVLTLRTVETLECVTLLRITKLRENFVLASLLDFS